MSEKRFYRVPVLVSVAPVQTYRKVVSVEASSPQEAADLILQCRRPGNSILSDAIDAPGWRSVGGRLGPIRPDRTVYDTYFDERSIGEWVAALQPQAEGEGGMVDLQSVEVRIDPNYPHFGLVGVPQPHRQHTNQQRGLDLYVTVFNLDTGERCFKKLYENRQGLHFKHTGYSPMYLNDFTERAVVYPFQVVRQPEGE